VQRPARGAHAPPREIRGTPGALLPGMDLVVLGLVAVFFVLSWGFVALCERL
jgi:hypothetical protein